MRRQIVDTAGNTVATYSYDPYGRTTAMTGGAIAINNPWRYRSGYQDGTGLYHFGARFYDPALGRWTQLDAIFNPLDPAQWNGYSYAAGDPTDFSDPSGSSKCGQWSLGGLVDCGAKAAHATGGFVSQRKCDLVATFEIASVVVTIAGAGAIVAPEAVVGETVEIFGTIYSIPDLVATLNGTIRTIGIDYAGIKNGCDSFLDHVTNGF